MAALTWQKMTRNQNDALLRTLVENNQQIGDSLSGLGDTAEQYVTNRTDKNTQEFMGQLMSAGDNAERQALIDSAEGTDYLNFEAIGDKSFELGADERALSTQIAQEARETAAETLIYNRDVTYEDKINTRELDEASNVLMMKEKREDEIVLQDEIKNQENFERDVKASKKLLDDDFARRQEALKAANTAKAEEALAKAKTEAEKLKIKLDAEAQLKIDLDIAKKSHEFNLKQQKSIDDANKLYLKNLADEPKALKGIYTKAAGGDENYTAELLGYDINDSNAFGQMRTKVLNRLNIDTADRAAVARFDRFLAREVTFNNNFGLLLDQNDFTFEQAGGGTIHFGFMQQGGDDEAILLEEKFLISQVGPAIKRDVLSWYKEQEGGSTSRQALDEDFAAYTKSRPGTEEEKEPLSIAGFKTWVNAQYAEEQK